MKQATSSVTHLIAKKLEISHHKARLNEVFSLFECVINVKFLQLFQEIGHSPYKVNLQWLVESMFVGRPIEESDFACNFEENRYTVNKYFFEFCLKVIFKDFCRVNF